MINDDAMIATAIKRFQGFLVQTNSIVEDCKKSSFEEFQSNFLQANWELIVEYTISFNMKRKVFLEVYGEGADGEDGSSRITFKEKLATHKLVFKPIEESVLDCLNKASVGEALIFDKLVTIKDGWYFSAFPFDCVLGLDSKGDRYVFRVEDVNWTLENVN
jgi:hypothetical protein